MPSPTAGRAILWWERRRIPVNLLVGAYGVACLLTLFGVIFHWRLFQPDAAVELIAVVVAAIEFNLCYTLGWMIEAPVRALLPHLTPKFGPFLLLVGLLFSLVVIALPLMFPGMLHHPFAR